MMKFYRLFLWVFLFTLTFEQCVYSKDVKFVQITDSHVAAAENPTSDGRFAPKESYFEKTIADVNSIPNLDFVVFTGDNIDKSNISDLQQFLKMANKLNVPYYIVIGNHEVFKSQDFTKKTYMKTVWRYSKNCKTKSANYVFQRNGFVFIVVDGAKEIIPGPSGYYKKDTLKWLDKELTKYKNSNVVIFQHFPIVEPYYNRTHTTYNKQDYFDMLKKHKNVVGIFSGHYHANGESMVDGVYHVSTPALIVPPHEYKVVEIEKKGKNCQVYTQLRHAE